MGTGARQPEDESLDGRRVAHDLLQSVVIIQSLAGAERVAAEPGSPLEGRLGLIEQEARTMGELCERVMGTTPRIDEVDLAAVAARVAERARCTFAGDLSLDTVPAHLEGDALEWGRCLYNLVVNACRAAGEDGRVAIQVRASDGTLRVSVGDSGPGFGRAVTGRASLGMVTVSRVVDRHGGHLEVGQSPLGGAELTVVVPPTG